MAEAVILLVVKKIGVALGNEAINLAASYSKKFVAQLTELQGSMGRISMELSLIHEFVSRMDVCSRNNQPYEIWVGKVRMLVYKIEDIVDDYLHLVGQKHDAGWRTYLKEGLKRPNVLLSLNKIASAAKDVETTVVHLFQAKDRWISMVGSDEYNRSSYIAERSQHLASMSRCLDEEDLVGADENRVKLQEWLHSDGCERSVIALHGMGGLGKTALAANVYKKQREKFDCHAWVSISQTYSIKDVLRSLISELDAKKSIRGNVDGMSIEVLQDELKGFLRGRKYLIILDDVWDPEAINDLFKALASNDKGSRVLITTRIDSVAHLAFPGRKIALEPLSGEDSWELFCRTAFPTDEDHECLGQVTELAHQIVSKCNGIPLAIVSVGRLVLVLDKTKEDFKRIHDQLDWELINNPSLAHVRNILYLSYIYLPTQLKSCFLYCSLFPEDHLLKRKTIIRWWIAEGFVERRGGSTMEEVAEGYLKELVQRNMLQLIETNSFGRMKSFRMHDIVRDLAIDLCRRECFGVAYNEEDKHDGGSRPLEGEEAARRLVVHTLQKQRDLSQVISSAHGHLRSVITLDTSGMSSLSSTLLFSLIAEKCRYISVLELNGLPIDKVPDAIGDLFNLRHLGLRGSKVKLLPKSIEKLSNLLTLDLMNSEVQELPGGIVKLKKLRHLFAERASDRYGRDFRHRTGVRIPKGLNNLTDLQTLQSLEAQDESVKHLGELKQMRSLRIWDVKRIQCEHLFQSFRQMDFLSYLSINTSDDDTVLQLDGMINSLPPNLQKLSLTARLAEAGTLQGAAAEFPPLFHTAASSFPMLHCLSLSWSHLTKDPLPSLSLFAPNLTRLVMTRAYIGEQLVFLQGCFPKLKKLSLRDMTDLKRLEIQPGAMASLEYFYITNLSGMVEVPSGIEFLVPTLKYLIFREITQEYLSMLRQCHATRSMRWRYSLR